MGVAGWGESRGDEVFIFSSQFKPHNTGFVETILKCSHEGGRSPLCLQRPKERGIVCVNIWPLANHTHACNPRILGGQVGGSLEAGNLRPFWAT